MMLFAVCITDTAALPHPLLYQNTVLFYIFCYLGFQKASATVSVVTQQFSKKLLFFPPISRLKQMGLPPDLQTLGSGTENLLCDS